MKQSKRGYYEHKFNAVKYYLTLSFLHYRIINGMINSKNHMVESLETKIVLDDIIHEASHYIANLFNNYFVGKGTSIAESTTLWDVLII